MIAAVGLTIYFWYGYRKDAVADAFLDRARQLEKEGKLNSAVNYYQRYLTARPADSDVLVQLVDVYSQGERTGARLRRLNQLLYRTLGQIPDRHDLRVQLADNLLDLGAFKEASTEATSALSAGLEDDFEARKIVALARMALSDVDSTVDPAQAISDLTDLSNERPGDTELAVVTASALRNQPSSSTLSADTDSASMADVLIDQLVAADPTNVDALLARYRYRSTYRLPNAAEDLAAALELDPSHVEAQLLAASDQDFSHEIDPEKTLRDVIETSPSDARGYLALADLLTEKGERDEAIRLLKAGKAETDSDPLLGLALAVAQLDANRTDEAEGTILDLVRETAPLLARLDGRSRDSLTGQLRLLEARLAAARGDDEVAIDKLQAVVATSQRNVGRTKSTEWGQATNLLAQLHAKVGQSDKAAYYWEQLAQAFPHDPRLVEAAVESLLKHGRSEEAIQLIEDHQKISEPSDRLLVQRALAHLATQLKRQVNERNWAEFSRALAAAKEATADDVNLTLSEVQYLIATDDIPAAMNVLRSSEGTLGDDARYWQYAALIYQQVGEVDDAQRALDEHQEVAKSVVESARLRTVVLVRDKKFAEAAQFLADAATSAEASERGELRLMQASTLASSGDYDRAFDFLKKELEGFDNADEALLQIGIEVAATVGDLKRARKWESQLIDKSNNSFEARFAGVRLDILDFVNLAHRDRQNLEQAIGELTTERPNWYPVVALRAAYARLNDQPRRALIDYQRAVELGDRRPATLQQLVALLYEAGRLDEVEDYMAMLDSDQQTLPFFDALAIEIAVRKGQSQLALDLAREGVERHPEDPQRRLYLGALLMRSKKSEEAVEVLTQAAREFPDDISVWTALFNAYVNSGQVDVARRALDSLTSSSLLPKERRHLVAGQGYQIIGDVAKAEEQYKLAIAADPTSVEARLRHANLIAERSPNQARDEYRAILENLAPTNTEARQRLAVLLAATGESDDWEKLLDSAPSSGLQDSETNDRLRALLRSQQGRTRDERIANCRIARDILEQLIESRSSPSQDLNRSVLARILQREAALSGDASLVLAARDQLRAAANEGPPSRSDLANYIEFLLQEAQNPSVTSSTTANDAKTDLEEQRFAFLSDAEARLADLKRLRTEDDRQLEIVTVAFESRLQHAQGDQQEAVATLDGYIRQIQDEEESNENSNAQRYLNFGQLYAMIGEHEKAESWYRKLMEISPDAYLLVAQALVDQGREEDAVSLGLEVSGGKPTPNVAKVWARLLTVTDSTVEPTQGIREALATVVSENQDNIELLQAEAVMQASRGDYEAAIASLRRILELAPNDALTLNNLATLLAERPNQRAEALELIEKAIGVAGRNPMFLDTKGTIYVKLEEAEQAIASLEEATAGRAPDARYYLHLAAAYQLDGRNEEAWEMLNEARAFGLENFVLTEDDRKMLAKLENLRVQEGNK